jgi:hypothetical protein
MSLSDDASSNWIRCPSNASSARYPQDRPSTPLRPSAKGRHASLVIDMGGKRRTYTLADFGPSGFGRMNPLADNVR